MFEKMFKKYALEEEKLPKQRIMKNKAEVMRLAGIEENPQKSRKKLPKRAVIIPVAAAVVAVGTVSAGAAGFNLFDAFQRYFSAQTEEEISETVDPGAAGLAEYEKVVELDDYTLSVNGFMGDRFSVLVYYDITYKADKYFENGELKQEFLKRSPVHFFLANKSGGGGSHENISVNGNTVSYVQEYTASEGFDQLDGGEYELKLRVTFADTTDLSAGLRGNLCDPVMMDATFPVPEELSFSTDVNIPLADKEFHLNAVDISPLSVGFSFDVSLSEEDNNTLYDGEIALLMKDGTEKDLSMSEKNWHFDETSAKLIAHYGLPIKTEDIAGVRYAGCTFKIENGEIVQTKIAESAESADIPNNGGDDTDAGSPEETSRTEDDINVIKRSDGAGVVYTQPENTEDFSLDSIPNIVKTDYTEELDGYTVTVRGVVGDKHCAKVYYDITYNDEDYFENGELKDEFRLSSPLWPTFLGAGGSDSRFVSEKGNTVTFLDTVFTYDGFAEEEQTGDYLIPLIFNGDIEKRLDVKIPASTHYSLNVSEEIILPASGKAATLKNIEAGGLSTWFEFSDTPENELAELKKTFSLLMRDGTRIDPDQAGVHSGMLTKDDDKIVYFVIYDEFIDPDNIAQIELSGKTFTAE